MGHKQLERGEGDLDFSIKEFSFRLVKAVLGTRGPHKKENCRGFLGFQLARYPKSDLSQGGADTNIGN